MTQIAPDFANLPADLEAMFAPDSFQNPYPHYERVRRHGNVLYLPEWNSAFVLSLESVSGIFRHAGVASGGGMDTPEEAAHSEFPASSALMGNMMLFHNHASHARLRGLVSQAFTPRAIEETHEFIDGTVTRLLGEFAQNELTGAGGDFVSSIAVQIPMLVILELLGVSSAERDQFKIWTTSIVSLFNGTSNARIEQDAVAMRAFFNDLANDLRTSSRGGVLAAMARADAGALSNDELLSNAVLLLAAGYETTTSVIAGSTLEFARQSESWQTLLERPELVSNAVEESLRLVSPVQLTSRVAMQNLEFEGQKIPKGSNISLILGAANRDPKRFANPDHLDLNRTNSRDQMAFASGPHYCLGAPLARLEIKVFLEAMMKSYPNFRVPEQQLEYAGNAVLRSLDKLEVSLD
jgi:cytochrome P450